MSTIIRSLEGRDAPNINWQMADWGEEPSPDEAKYIVNLGRYDSTKTNGLQVRGYNEKGKRVSKLFSYSGYDTLEACMRAAREWRDNHIASQEISCAERARNAGHNRSVTEVVGLSVTTSRKRGRYYPIAQVQITVGNGLKTRRWALLSHSPSAIADEAVSLLHRAPCHADKAPRTLRNEIYRGIRRGIRRIVSENPKGIASERKAAIRKASRKHDILY